MDLRCEGLNSVWVRVVIQRAVFPKLVTAFQSTDDNVLARLKVGKDLLGDDFSSSSEQESAATFVHKVQVVLLLILLLKNEALSHDLLHEKYLQFLYH
jgi:hypothetical protein